MKPLWKKIATILAVFILCTVLASGGEKEPEDIIKHLIRERTEIMNEYFCGHINYDEASDRIREIEKDSLLQEDIRALKDYFQTDIEEVTDFEISNLEITYSDEDMVCAVATITWEVHGTSGNELIDEIYSVIMEKDEKNYKLVQFF